VGVEQHPVAVAGHRDLPPEPLARIVVQIERPQPLPERQLVLVVPELDLDPKLLIRHTGHPTQPRRQSIEAHLHPVRRTAVARCSPGQDLVET
jgi:hypothetical protein